jgi:hypothetical protein
MTIFITTAVKTSNPTTVIFGGECNLQSEIKIKNDM